MSYSFRALQDVYFSKCSFDTDSDGGNAVYLVWKMIYIEDHSEGRASRTMNEVTSTSRSDAI